MVALHKHHEELRNVWGDIEETIPIVVPSKGETAGESEDHTTSVPAGESVLDAEARARNLAWWDVSGMLSF
jgi:hypothetical protein